jgi:hypothetical protein
MLVPAVGITVAYFIWPGYGWELMCYVYVVPVVVVNGWEWLEELEFMERVFGKKKDKGLRDEFEKVLVL